MFFIGENSGIMRQNAYNKLMDVRKNRSIIGSLNGMENDSPL